MSLNDNKEYWKAQFKLRKCRNCEDACICWVEAGVIYSQKRLMEKCKDPEIKEAVQTIEKIIRETFF